MAVEGGYRVIEDIKAGEWVFSRDQWDAGGDVSERAVEEVFERYAGVLHLHAGGAATNEFLYADGKVYVLAVTAGSQGGTTVKLLEKGSAPADWLGCPATTISSPR